MAKDNGGPTDHSDQPDLFSFLTEQQDANLRKKRAPTSDLFTNVEAFIHQSPRRKTPSLTSAEIVPPSRGRLSKEFNPPNPLGEFLKKSAEQESRGETPLHRRINQTSNNARQPIEKTRRKPASRPVPKTPVNDWHWRDNAVISTLADVSLTAFKTASHAAGEGTSWTVRFLNERGIPSTKAFAKRCANTCRDLYEEYPQCRKGVLTAAIILGTTIGTFQLIDTGSKESQAALPPANSIQTAAVEAAPAVEPKPERLQQLERIYKADLSRYQTIMAVINEKGELKQAHGMEYGMEYAKNDLQREIERKYKNVRDYRVILATINDGGMITKLEAIKNAYSAPEFAYFDIPEPKRPTAIAKKPAHGGRAVAQAKGQNGKAAGFVPIEINEAMLYAANATDPENYPVLIKVGGAESTFNPKAVNPDTKACGMMQFLESTLLETLYLHGEKHGYGDLAKKVKVKNGKYSASYKDRIKIREACFDPAFSITMAAEYMHGNQQYVSTQLGRELNDVDKYFTHFLGPAGAVRFLNAYDNPKQRSHAAASYVDSLSVSKNTNVFYTNGRKRSIGQVYALFENKFARPIVVETVAGPPPKPAKKPDLNATAEQTKLAFRTLDNN